MTLATLFNLAGPDLIVILFVVLLLFGGRNLPGLARSMGQAIREFTKAKGD
jgi:sec-independent protein translocase protein TatA